MPISPHVRDCSLELTEQEAKFFDNILLYLNGDSLFKDGVPVPNHLKSEFLTHSVESEGRPLYRLPHLEKLLSTFAAQSMEQRLAHPEGRRMLYQIQDLVSPSFPITPQANLFNLPCVDLPYIRAEFSDHESRHPDDRANFPKPYYGCLDRYEAFQFVNQYPKFADALYYQAAATTQLLFLYANPDYCPSGLSEVNWQNLAAPYPFEFAFDQPTPGALVDIITQYSHGQNEWLNRAPYLIQCVRQVHILIQALETFFHAIGFESGLKGIVDMITLNTDIDNFTPSAILDTDEVKYLTAAYDFFLREHKTYLAHELLHILHASFPYPEHVTVIRQQVIDSLEFPDLDFILFDVNDINMESDN